MRQLVELKKNANKFSEMGVEVVAIFREEAKGVEGLKKIRDRIDAGFTLGLDLNAERTADYSPGKMVFTNYVIDSTGVIRGVIEGDLRTRANSEQLLGVLAKIADENRP